MIQLDLQPELEAELAVEAEAGGVTLLELNESIIRKHFLPPFLQISAEEGIRQGLADLAAGRTRPAQEFFDEFREKYHVPRH